MSYPLESIIGCFHTEDTVEYRFFHFDVKTFHFKRIQRSDLLSRKSFNFLVDAIGATRQTIVAMESGPYASNESQRRPSALGRIARKRQC